MIFADLQQSNKVTRMAAAAKDLELWGKVAAAIGGKVEEVASMQEEERQELVKVLGLAPVEILDSDEEPLKDNHDNDDVYTYDISSDDEALVLAQVQGGAGLVKEERGVKREREGEEEVGKRLGWGECPMCEQRFWLEELQLHSMACQVDTAGTIP